MFKDTPKSMKISENIPSKRNKDSEMKDTKGNSFMTNSVVEGKKSTTITLENLNVKIEIESDDAIESEYEEEPYTDYTLKEEMPTDPEEQQQAIYNSNCSTDINTNLKSFGQNQQLDDNDSASRANSESKMEYEVKLEPVDELYAGHDIKKDMVVGPVELQTGTNAAEDENEVQSNSKTSEQNDHSNHIVPRIKLENEMMYEVELEPTSECTGDGMVPGSAKHSATNAMDEENGAPLSKKSRIEIEVEITSTEDATEGGNIANSGTEINNRLSKSPTKKEGSRKNMNNKPLATNSSEQVEEKWDLTRYVESHHSMLKAEVYFKCDECPYQSVSQGALDRHKKLHDKTRRFVCDMCKYRFKDRIGLQQHLKKVHSDVKLYECSSCDYKTSDHSHLKRHSRTHTREKSFSCTMCEYKCAQKGNLITHMRIHTGEKPYCCSFCGCKFALTSNLTKHLLRGNCRQEFFPCTQCSYKSTRVSDLKKHLIKHSDEKPFACTLCEYKCKQKNILSKHLKLHSGTIMVTNVKNGDLIVTKCLTGPS